MSPSSAVTESAVDAGAMTPPSRLLNRRTILSLVVAALIVAVAVWRAPINWSDAWARIRHATLGLYVAALAVYYASFLVRTWRWKLLLRNAGEDRQPAKLLPILMVSFFVNCVVPAKMGDIYRAYLARLRQAVPAAMALGTIIAERLLDLVVLMLLLLIAGAIVFHDRAPGVLIPYLIAGVAVCAAGIGAILVMRAGRGQRLLRLLPEAVFHRYESFRMGTVDSFRNMPTLVSLTALVWAMESGRLALVVYALGDGSSLGPAQLLLIALVAALLTTVPFLPGGLGLVEAGMVGVLISVGGIGREAALSIALLDRSISYGSVVIVGAIVFAVLHVRVPRPEDAAATGAAP
ncbi:MAG: flippase-like domain-containing protein [Candidatus Dormibacteraeota bacterium]|nr:flippase-like domain-containing protein [Candidatus Dormibacteraeota bacterium]